MKKTSNSKKQNTIIQKVLAAVFLAAIFYIGSATFPQAMEKIGGFFTDEKHDILAVRLDVSDCYSEMLVFSGGIFKDKGGYINLNGLMARVMGQRYMNYAMKLDNGHLVPYRNPERNMAQAIMQITKVHSSQQEKGKAFLYVLAPNQIPLDEDIVPAGYFDHSNINADVLLEALRENGVPVLDLRDQMPKDGIVYPDAFFTTDQHWTPETGFWAYTKIVECLEETGLIEQPDRIYTDVDEYDIRIYENAILGTEGRKTGVFYAGLDDLHVITPKFETGVYIEIPSLSYQNSGSLEQTAFNYDEITKEYFTAEPYNVYGYGVQSFKSFRNENAPVDLKVLAIGDSFANIPYTFLPLIFSSFEQLDMRVYKGDFEQYYSEYDPDLVIILTSSAHHINNLNATYDFFNDLPVEE